LNSESTRGRLVKITKIWYPQRNTTHDPFHNKERKKEPATTGAQNKGGSKNGNPYRLIFRAKAKRPVGRYGEGVGGGSEKTGRIQLTGEVVVVKWVVRCALLNNSSSEVRGMNTKLQR